jgi:hypothetical protein
VVLARRNPELERVLPGAFQLKLGVWLAMHENLRSTPRCRAVFDGLAAGLKTPIGQSSAVRRGAPSPIRLSAVATEPVRCARLQGGRR